MYGVLQEQIRFAPPLPQRHNSILVVSIILYVYVGILPPLPWRGQIHSSQPRHVFAARRHLLHILDTYWTVWTGFRFDPEMMSVLTSRLVWKRTLIQSTVHPLPFPFPFPFPRLCPALDTRSQERQG